MNDPRIKGTIRFKIETVAIAVLALASLAILIATVGYAGAQSIESNRIRVGDADIIALKGIRQHVRLVGFNACS